MKIVRKIALLLFLIAGAATLHADAPSSTTELQRRASDIQQQINNDYRDALHMQAEARKQKDAIKLGCVNDKLILMKVEMNLADAANEQLGAEISTSTQADRGGAFSQLVTASTRVHDLRQGSATCVGERELGALESSTTYTHPTFLDDPTAIPFAIYAEPPVYASPFN